MTSMTLTVNGQLRTSSPEPRMHLADFLRDELLLTGTHLGCEHGVCGACTVLIDGEPARACITFAATCGGRVVETIEGLDDDPVATALREAFTREHALQCGFCTPGMLVTARDIVMRLPQADDDRIRLELSGNLCRCTGYNGIVRAIRRVLDARTGAESPWRPALPPTHFSPRRADGGQADAGQPILSPPPTAGSARPNHLRQTVRLALGADAVWAAIQDPGLVASCVPGARLLSQTDGQITGEMLVSLGPIQAKFTGAAQVTYTPATRSGGVSGQGQDQASGTRLNAEATFQVVEDGATACHIILDMDYALRGALAQFGRGPVVQVFAAEVAGMVGANLSRRLRGEAPLPAQSKIGLGLLLRLSWRALFRLLFHRHG